jgi:hypothetical protein
LEFSTLQKDIDLQMIQKKDLEEFLKVEDALIKKEKELIEQLQIENKCLVQE